MSKIVLRIRDCQDWISNDGKTFYVDQSHDDEPEHFGYGRVIKYPNQLIILPGPVPTKISNNAKYAVIFDWRKEKLKIYKLIILNLDNNLIKEINIKIIIFEQIISPSSKYIAIYGRVVNEKDKYKTEVYTIDGEFLWGSEEEDPVFINDETMQLGRNIKMKVESKTGKKINE